MQDLLSLDYFFKFYYSNNEREYSAMSCCFFSNNFISSYGFFKYNL